MIAALIRSMSLSGQWKRWHRACQEAQKLEKKNSPKCGRPKSDDNIAAAIQAAKAKASEIKNSSYTLGKAPEHLTENQQIRLDMIQANDPQLYRAYRLKESLRLLLRSTDVKQAEADLKHWLFWASHSWIAAFVELYRKIRLIIRKSYGFRNMQNMMDMVYLVCSKIKVSLPNRKSIQVKPA
ncbi:MAG: transposase [Erysipelotrichaceae bacterium]|nr:transposase [Solobacterium sp.]